MLPSLRDPLKHMRNGEHYNGWYRILKMAGIRHRTATDIANSGIPVKVGMVLTAHKTVAMFIRYIHTKDAPVRVAAELVANRRKTITEAQREQAEPTAAA